MCFLGRWQEELHNILLPLVNSGLFSIPFQQSQHRLRGRRGSSHRCCIWPILEAALTIFGSPLQLRGHPSSRPGWKGALGPCPCGFHPVHRVDNAPVEDVSVWAKGVFSQQRQSPLHPLLEKQRGPDALSPKPPSDLSCTFPCNPLTVYRNPRQLHSIEV